MARDFAVAFYHSTAWKRTRQAYIRSVRGLCERCLEAGRFVPGKVVHHKVHLDAENVNDPSITLNFDNLELLCLDCHNKEHFETAGNGRMVRFDENGKVVRE